MAKGIIFDIKEMSVNDGPGVRTTIFFKGCPLRCRWCHNPEGVDPAPKFKQTGILCTNCGKCLKECGHEDCRPYGRCLHICPLGRLGICGHEVDSAELTALVQCQADFLQGCGGGITLSGGEPLMQPEFLLALMEQLKPLHVAVETSAYADEAVFRAMIERVDLVMADIKHMDNETHRHYTGVGNKRILSNLSLLMASDKPFIVRVPLIPGINDDTANLERTAEFLKGTENLLRVELMPYNVLAGAKYRAVGLEYTPDFDVNALPNADCKLFEDRGIPCRVL